jgi:hypothetical protein
MVQNKKKLEHEEGTFFFENNISSQQETNNPLSGNKQINLGDPIHVLESIQYALSGGRRRRRRRGVQPVSTL